MALRLFFRLLLRLISDPRLHYSELFCNKTSRGASRIFRSSYWQELVEDFRTFEWFQKIKYPVVIYREVTTSKRNKLYFQIEECKISPYMPFKGFCLTCNTEISAGTKPELGEALIAHHKTWLKRSRGNIEDRCNVFQTSETDVEGKVINQFGLDTTAEVVCHSWTGTLWYEGKRGKERE